LNNKKQLWVLAGGNGAGKSTFYHLYLEPLAMPFINADILANYLYPDAPELHSYDAAVIASHMRTQLLQEERTFCFETVFSHPSKIDFVAQAKTMGYEIILVYIHLQNASLNQARVAQRVSEGGHNVPDEKVINRIPRTVQNIQKTVALCDFVYLLDNSFLNNPFKQVARIKHGDVKQVQPLPQLAREILQEILK